MGAEPKSFLKSLLIACRISWMNDAKGSLIKIAAFIVLSFIFSLFFTYQPTSPVQSTAVLSNIFVPEVVQFPKLNISYAEKTMLDIYEQLPSGFFPDLIERVRVAETGASPVYGELEYNALVKLIEMVNATSEDTFLDLGSGTGKLVMQYVLLTRGVGYGLEFDTHRHETAIRALRILNETMPQAAERIHYRHSDIMKEPFPKATVVFLDGLMFPRDALGVLAERILKYTATQRLRVWSVGKWLNFPEERIERWEQVLTDASWSSNQSSYVYWISPPGVAVDNSQSVVPLAYRSKSSGSNGPIKLDARSIRLTFTAFDEDGDGKLSLPEFTALLSNRGQASIYEPHELRAESLPAVGDRVEITCAIGCKKGKNAAGTQGLLSEYVEESDRWRILLDNKEKMVRLHGDNFRVLFKAPLYLKVDGRVGSNERMNGIYKKGAKLFEGKPFYFKLRAITKHYVIRWYEKNREWLFDHEGLRSDSGCNAYAADDVDFPSQVSKDWYVYNRSSFEPDPAVNVTIMPKEIEKLMYLPDSEKYVGKVSDQ